LAALPRALALLSAGSSIPARIAMMAITTSSSIRVNELPIILIIGSYSGKRKNFFLD
jgi:hypothetical protein